MVPKFESSAIEKTHLVKEKEIEMVKSPCSGSEWDKVRGREREREKARGYAHFDRKEKKDNKKHTRWDAQRTTGNAPAKLITNTGDNVPVTFVAIASVVAATCNFVGN